MLGHGEFIIVGINTNMSLDLFKDMYLNVCTLVTLSETALISLSTTTRVPKEFQREVGFCGIHSPSSAENE